MFQKILLVAVMALPVAALAVIKAPLEIPGGDFGGGGWGGKSDINDQAAAKAENGADSRSPQRDLLRCKADFPAPGVWYLWLKVRPRSQSATLLRYNLDGNQVLRSSRSEILVQPYAGTHWVNQSRYPDFKIEVHVDKPGVHTLEFKLLQGNLAIEKIYATLFYSATLKNEVLDHSKDPGQGRLDFPVGALSSTGVQANFKSPAVTVAGRAFYVDSEKGNDVANGSTPGLAWKSLSKVNNLVLQPGDVVFLKRGSVWQEGLAPQGSGTAQKWITLATYGQGERPLVDGVNRPALRLMDQEYWQVQDIRFSNNPDYKQDAVDAGMTNRNGGPRIRGLRLINCVAFDSGGTGFHVEGNPGHDGVWIENCEAFCNAVDGIAVAGKSQKGGRNTLIRRCTTYSNPGMAGIWISGGENGLIEDCLAYNNACVNIWAWNAINITMRRCEVFRGRPPRDAAGFDIDYSVQASTIEYCYSHHNEGDAYLLMGSGEGVFDGFKMRSSHNIMRYSIAEGMSPIDLIETFQHGKIYNNLAVGYGAGTITFVAGGWPDLSDKDPWKGGGWPSDNEIRNNIIIAKEGAVPLEVDADATRQRNVWDHNLYWKDAPGPFVRWGGRRHGLGFWRGDDKTGTFPPTIYPDLASFKAAVKQEPHGMQADPGVLAPGAGSYGRLPLEAYRVKAASVARGAGQKVVLDPAWLKARRAHLSETGAGAYGIPMDPAEERVDYWGSVILPAAKLSIGPQQP